MSDWYSYPTNYSNGTMVDGVGKMFFNYPSTILNDTLAAGIIVMIWVVSFFLSSSVGTRKAIAVSSFISFVFSIFFFNLGLINPVIPIVLIIMTIIGVLGSKESGGSL